MDNLQQFKRTYFEECAELLASAEINLAALVEGTADADALNAVFRAVHSIKGGGGAFGFEALVRYAHVFETSLDALRAGRIAANAPVLALMIRANDVLADFVRAAESESTLAADHGSEIVAALGELAGGPPAARPAAAAPAAAATHGPATFRIRFAPGPELFQKANEPLLFVRELRGLGRLKVSADLSRLPSFEDMRPEDAYLAWTFELETERDAAAIADVFEFVVDDCEVRIEPVAAAPAAPPAAAHAEAPAGAAPSAPPAARSEEPAAAAPRAVAAATASAVPQPSSSVRVDVEKIDRLVNLVGEMVIAQAMVSQQAGLIPPEQFPALIQGIETLTQHTRSLQDSVMAIRAQPVRSVFQRLPRLVRELAQKLGKDVRLVTTGEATEIDKTVIEQLADPLTHMIRNALDHGLETPEERVAAGKPAQGTIHLNAEHRSGRVVIEISDDGRGIDRKRVLKKAQEKGLVPAGATLSNEEIDALILLPGFSTAQNVSDVSGRGVGMDVVKRNIQGLGGRVAIESVEGSGSRFLLSLPLTLAVLDAMLVAVGGQAYALPLTTVVESLRPRAEDVHSLAGRGDVLLIRGDQVPLIYVHRIFGIGGAVADASNGIVVLVDTDSGRHLGLVVDEIVGQQQVVIKSLETNYGVVDGISAATILGNGRVALILDIVRLQALAARAAGDGRRRPLLAAELQ